MRLAGKPGAVSDLTKLDLVCRCGGAYPGLVHALRLRPTAGAGSHISADASAPTARAPHQHLTVGRVAMAAKARPVFRARSSQVPGWVGRHALHAIVVAIVARAAVIATPET